MKKCKVTRKVLETVSSEAHIPFDYLYRLYRMGYLSDKSIIQFWEKALYRRGIIKRKPDWMVRRERTVRKFLKNMS